MSIDIVVSASVVSGCTVIACVSVCPLKHAWGSINDRVRGNRRFRAGGRAHGSGCHWCWTGLGQAAKVDLTRFNQI